LPDQAGFNLLLRSFTSFARLPLSLHSFTSSKGSFPDLALLVVYLISDSHSLVYPIVHLNIPNNRTAPVTLPIKPPTSPPSDSSDPPRHPHHQPISSLAPTDLHDPPRTPSPQAQPHLTCKHALLKTKLHALGITSSISNTFPWPRLETLPNEPCQEFS
jgi:hypothetical protein